MGQAGTEPSAGSWSVAIALAFAGSNALAADLPEAPRERLQLNVRLQDEQALPAVRSAVAGAFERLGDASCGRVLADFENVKGERLDAALAAQGRTAQGFLSLVLFYDGSRHLLCGDGGRLAFTTPFSRVVFVCADRFRQKREWNPEKGRRHPRDAALARAR